MGKTFRTPAAFKASLEERLRTIAAQRNIPINTLRLKLIMERLLARFFQQPNPPWLLKGGYAMELRYRPRARTTRDIDLSISTSDARTALKTRLEELRDQLQEAADTDLGDFLTFRIESPKAELQGAPAGGARFPCETFLAGKIYGRFNIDVGFGDDATGEPETLLGEDLLAFAGVPPPRVLAIPRAQQFAEKLHAYTFAWPDRQNTRTKDLVDMLLLIETGELDRQKVSSAIRATFSRRASHALPQTLPPPPANWDKEFAAMANEAMLKTTDLNEAIEILQTFFESLPPLP